MQTKYAIHLSCLFYEVVSVYCTLVGKGMYMGMGSPHSWWLGDNGKALCVLCKYVSKHRCSSV